MALVGAVLLAAFVVIELHVAQPLLRLDLFANRAFAIAALTTLLGMFAFLGTRYIASIRMTAVQGFTPLHATVALFLMNILGLPCIR